MPNNYTCDFNGCKRPSTLRVYEEFEGAASLVPHMSYCSDFHAGVALIQKWAAASKSGTTIKRLYKTASGLLDKLAKAVEKEWAKTAPKES